MSFFEDTNPKPLVELLVEIQLYLAKVTESNTSQYFQRELLYSERHRERL